jgi:2-keto-3-deoxy-L-fuconate dehydrogenase
MDPILCDVFAEHGAIVIVSSEALSHPEAPASVVAASGHIDILVANLAILKPTSPANETSDEEWQSVFAALVDQLPRLARLVLPPMIERRSGKILLMGSVSAAWYERSSTYSATRGAQLAYVQAVGVELAEYNVQVNAIAQNFVDNPTVEL